MINVPTDDAPSLPQIGVLNEVIGASTVNHPPVRDIDGVVASTGQVAVPDMHAFTPADANPEEEKAND